VSLVNDPSPVTVAERLVAGDEHALEECYHRYGPAVRGYLRRFVPSPDVEDVLQETFLDVWRCRRQLDPDRRFEPWLFAIARRRAIDALRRRRGVVEVAVVRDLMGTDGNQLAEQLAWAAEIRAALVQMSAEQREVIELAYFSELTQREIAERLGIPLGTVKARVSRGLRRLAVLMEGRAL
jgi:RNA polymerase sigma factor (sigma-70 family)